MWIGEGGVVRGTPPHPARGRVTVYQDSDNADVQGSGIRLDRPRYRSQMVLQALRVRCEGSMHLSLNWMHPSGLRSWAGQDSNLQPTGYESAALKPLSYPPEKLWG